jgi:crotonobetainyl-CoA:carnitine CoA-transferase CaiB-like acyl-CoA transferase
VIEVDVADGAGIRAALGEHAPASTSGAPMKQLGLVARLTKTPGEVRTGAPTIGQHTDEVLAELDVAAGNGAIPAALPEPRADPAPPLEGVTVLDFSTIIATPLGGSTLADLGARVIKVEQIGGDPWRWMGNGSLGALKTNAGKESICLDLKSDEGQRIIGRLIEETDVILHNFRPGVPERLGMGYAQASALRPDIVYVSMNGYGPDGPGAHRPATHPIPGAGLGGALWQAGEGMPPHATNLEELREGARRLFRSNEVNPDPNVAAVVATAALLGLAARQRLGVGQQIFIDMMGANAWANADDYFWYEGREPRPTVDGELHGTGPLYRLYECREGWVFLGLVLEEEWRRFCSLAGCEDLAVAPRFSTRQARLEHADALVEALGALFACDTADAWERRLATEGLGCVRADGPVPGAFFLDDPQVEANHFTALVEHPTHGTFLRHGPLIRRRDAQERLRVAPMAGQHVDAILGEIGMNAAEIARLRETGVVWSEPGVPVVSQP